MTQPDFIVIPTQLLQDELLQPSDRILFGYIYWMTKMALMRCVASNGTFMQLTGMSERNISMALRRLEQRRYVRIIYKDEARRHRVEIMSLVAFSTVNDTRPHERAFQTAQTFGLDRTNVLQNKNTYKEELKRKKKLNKENVGNSAANAKAADDEQAKRAKRAKYRKGSVSKITDVLDGKHLQSRNDSASIAEEEQAKWLLDHTDDIWQ